MRKRVLLLAVSCKTGGLCPGGIDLDNPSQWIRIVANDGNAGAVQGCEIDYAEPLDVVEFDGKHVPQGCQQENWVILNNSCVNKGRLCVGGRRDDVTLIKWAYDKYSYHGFWGNYKSYLTQDELDCLDEPSETMMKVSNLKVYINEYGKAKVDFNWSGSKYGIKWISMTDPDYYEQIDDKPVEIDIAIIVVSIPKYCDWKNPNTGENQAFKFVSRIYPL